MDSTCDCNEGVRKAVQRCTFLLHISYISKGFYHDNFDTIFWHFAFDSLIQAAIEKEKLHLLCADVPILENQVDMYVCICRDELGQATLIL